MKQVCKSFGDVQANRNVDLTVERGEIHALLGENGAGKTTLMNILYGIYQPDSGSVLLDGQAVRISSPGEAISLKIGMVHQHFMLVPTLSVSQNITLGIRERGYPFTDRKAVDRKISRLSREYGLDIDPTAMIEDLSVGVQQRVEIIKLLYHQAELLILDEPTAVLTPQETENLFDVLKRLKEDGRSIIIITHRIAEVQSIADRVTVLRDGAMVGCDDIGNMDKTRMSELMIGRRLETAMRSGAAAGEPPDDSMLLSLENISLKGANVNILNDISLALRAGEILGLAGVDGNGQKELAEVIVGIRHPDDGRVVFEGREVTGLGVRKRKRIGMAYVPDDRHHDGLILDMDLASNLILNSHDQMPFARYRFMNDPVRRRHAEQRVSEYQVKTPGVETMVRYLSGGNQQKIILARELEGVPKLIVANQPTRGLDIGAEEFVNKLLLAQRDRGAGILLVSADLDQLMKLSDRIAVIFDGRITGLMNNDPDLEPGDIGLKMAGITGETR